MRPRSTSPKPRPASTACWQGSRAPAEARATGRGGSGEVDRLPADVQVIEIHAVGAVAGAVGDLPAEHDAVRIDMDPARRREAGRALPCAQRSEIAAEVEILPVGPLPGAPIVAAQVGMLPAALRHRVPGAVLVDPLEHE